MKTLWLRKSCYLRNRSLERHFRCLDEIDYVQLIKCLILQHVEIPQLSCGKVSTVNADRGCVVRNELDCSAV